MIQKSTSFSQQQGLSLIEMMISMVLGLFLVGGLSTMFLKSKESDKTRQAVTEMEANARLAIEFLNNGIQHAGYRSIYIVPFDKPFLSEKDGTPPNTICRGGGASNSLLLSGLTHPYTEDGSGSNSDQITSVFLADNPDDNKNTSSRRRVFRDCAGGEITQACSADTRNGMADPMTAKLYNSFYVDSNNQLVCIGSRTAGSNPIVIAENIENMQIRYGVASDNSLRYKTATDVETDKEWRNVKSVQIALLIRSNKNILTRDETRKFDLLDQKNLSVTSGHEKKLHRVYSTTINLANRN